jgi:hypothetical protein
VSFLGAPCCRASPPALQAKVDSPLTGSGLYEQLVTASHVTHAFQAGKQPRDGGCN